MYRLTRDGEQISKFHELCDNKGPTLTLFSVEDGNCGGIYTPLSWDSYSSSKGDMKSFMFNLNKKEKYKKKNNEWSIYCNNNYNPWTSNFGFKNNMKGLQHQGKDGINEHYENGSEILPNNLNLKHFNAKEVEVYKIII